MNTATAIYDIPYGIAELNMVFVPCVTLRRMRIAADLTQPKLAVLCYLAMLQIDCEGVEVDHPARTASPQTLMRAIIFLRKGSCLDSTHISKFEKGHQRPWRKARVTLCFVFSQVSGRNISEAELFPETNLNLDTNFPAIVEMLFKAEMEEKEQAEEQQLLRHR